MNAAAYVTQLQQLLPTGAAWNLDADSNMTMVLEWIASELANVDARAAQLIEESDPRTTSEMLPDWETSFGLPDTCSSLANTTQERRSALVDKIIRRGGQNLSFYYGIAERLGYEITIKEFGPFITGRSRCGDVLGGAPSNRLYWRVTVLQPRITLFRTGVSRCGDKLGSIDRAADLECVFRLLSQSHVQLIFAYEGV